MGVLIMAMLAYGSPIKKYVRTINSAFPFAVNMNGNVSKEKIYLKDILKKVTLIGNQDHKIYGYDEFILLSPEIRDNIKNLIGRLSKNKITLNEIKELNISDEIKFKLETKTLAKPSYSLYSKTEGSFINMLRRNDVKVNIESNGKAYLYFSKSVNKDLVKN